MPMFMVMCYESAEWDGNEPRKVEAESALESAENVCGEELIEGAKAADLRAEATPLTKPRRRVSFRRAEPRKLPNFAIGGGTRERPHPTDD
jgi:hypothetical protein